ncbi:MAG: tetratricopeptide repeat protein [Bacteriovoracaceae bacterium]
MKSVLIAFVLVAGYTWAMHAQDFWGKFQSRVKEVNGYELKALALTKENRILKASINDLKYQMKAIEAKNSFLEIKLGQGKERTIASSTVQKAYTDLVNFDVYKWSVNEMLSVAKKEFGLKNFEKSAQFFNEALTRYPKDKFITEEVLYQAGMSSFKTKHYDWAQGHLGRLIAEYPTSKYFRGAKLWVAMSQHETGEKEKFFKTVEEFRLKYRNTEEWAILSKHYENFYQKYK